MERLVSLNKSYKDFCDSYKIKMQNKSAGLNARNTYGGYWELPVDERLVVFFLKDVDEVTNTSGRSLAQSFLQNDEYKGYEIRIIVDSKKQAECITWASAEQVLLRRDNRTYRAYATAGYIITERNLPDYFIKKEGQKVVRLYAESGIESEGRCKESERIENARGVISRLLNTSSIITDSPNQEKTLKEACQLGGIYTGDIFCLPEWRDAVGNVESSCWNKLLKYIFKQESGEGVLSRFPVNKKRILIYANCNRNTRKYVNLLSQSIDYEEYDVTFVTKRPKEFLDEKQLMALNEKLRIVYRTGTFSCSEAEYIDLQYLLAELTSFEDLKQALSHINRDILKREIQRILGDLSFSLYISIGDFDTVWSALALEIPAKRKMRIELADLAVQETRCLTPLAAKKFENQIKLYEEFFDEIVFPSQRHQKAAIEHRYYGQEKTRVFVFPSSAVAEKAIGEREIISFQGKSYYVGEKYHKPFKGMQLLMLPLPSPGTAGYIANGHMSDIDMLLEGYANWKDGPEKKILYIYGVSADRVMSVAHKYHVESQVMAINQVELEIMPSLRDYFQCFRGYLTTDSEEYCPLRVAMEMQDKDIIEVSPKGNRILNQKLFADKEQYEGYIKQSINTLFEQ